MDEIVVIDLFGEEFRFKPDGQVENPKQVALYLKKYIKEAEDLFQNNPSEKNKIAILLLAAMNLSKDFHELKLQYSELEKKINSRMSSLIEKIDKGIEKRKQCSLL
ncbi:MAG: cell division protein ZapA [Proteobacteria bacterium]|nr:cell division protein ZapA [Pseudomonadota bacterium]MBU1582742.1 cell division protein ZapA [Pseudomonadota bacterium]MBU2453599.1 cell division protein ZapA [Pseudomonadota bacterium]